MTKHELEAIKLRCQAAAPGPWVSYIEGRDHYGGSNFIMVGEGANRLDDIEMSGVSHADQDFIAHARQDVPALLAEVERLSALLVRRLG